MKKTMDKEEWRNIVNKRNSLYDIKSFYNKKAVLKASFQGMRYQVEQHQEDEESDKVLRATIWPEPFCYEKTEEEKKTVQEFPYCEEGLDQAYDWLCKEYEERKEEWIQARDNPYEGLF